MRNRILHKFSPLLMRSLALVFLAAFFSVAGWSREVPRYALILSDPAPVRARAQGGQAAVQAAQTRVLAAQAAVVSQLKARGVRITGSSHTLLNAIFVAAEPDVAAQLASIGGVIQIARLRRFRLNLDHAVQLINVPAAYSLIGGASKAGAGVKIGMIDTGITATHPAFQDSALTPPAGFPICQVNFGTGENPQWMDCTATDATKGFPICASLLNCAYTNNKVIVARSYVPLLNSAEAQSSTPDDNSPRDRVGHGTATAMAAAGVTNTGPADTITGVAPQAFLGSYKVFGSPGVNPYASEDAIIEAIEDAFHDGMDIVSISLGAPALTGPVDTGRTCGENPGDSCDPEASVVQEAVAQGMVVVVAAGNQGENGLLTTAALNTIGSPADAPNAIAVAATTNSHNWGNAVTVNGLGSYLGQFGTGPIPTAVVTGPLGDVANVGDPLGCTAPPAGSLSGLIALVGRGTCTFLQKIQSLEAAGAVGAIVYNNPGDDTLVAMSGLSGTTIPAIFIGYDNGKAIETYLAGNPQATVSISPNLSAINDTTYNQVAPFSSHGPVLGSGALKPDVAAVGVDLYLAGESYDPNGELYSANGYLVSQGTSFSTPQVAGIAALVKQQNPALSAMQIRSSVINTATQSLTENGNPASVLAVGAGLANAAFAVANTLIATPTSASFGVVKSSTLPVTVEFQLTNTGTTTMNLSVAINRRTAEVTAHTSVNLPNLTLTPGQTSTSLSLMLSGTLPGPGIYEGFVTITGGPNPLSIPYLYLVGDGVPDNLISEAGAACDGTVDEQSTGGYVIPQVIDQYGVPVTGVPVTFSVTSGGGKLTPVCITVCSAANDTDNYGQAAAEMILGPNPGNNVYSATAGGLTASFTATAVAQPAISPNGAVVAGSYAHQPAAPGSYIVLFGDNLAGSASTYSTPYLPVSLNSVSVSFDAPNISVPGHIVFVSAGQINLQVPWELQGQSAVQIKVTNSDSQGAVYVMPLETYSPALFVIPSGGQNIAAALDQNNNVITTSNPVAQGSVVQLFANGLGPVNNQPASGDPAPSAPSLATTTTTPIVTIGGVTVPAQNVLFSGMTPGNAALYQINVVVPEGIVTSNVLPNLQPITISIGGVTSPTVLIPVQ
jgi:minor extracellular serine protease Vpr